MDNTKDYLTKAKFDEFTKELAELKTTKRREIAESLEYAKSLGDLSENAEYHEARDAQGHLEDRINHLEALLRSASIVSNHDTSAVSVGSKITIGKKGGSPKTYTLVGSEEADAAKGLISVRSPLGTAALGCKKGQSFTFASPAGTVVYDVLDIQ